MKIFDFTISGWWLVAGGVALLGGLILLISSGLNDQEVATLLKTPVRDMTVGHLAALVVLAGLFFGRT
jgi:hypothetical protein